MGRNSRKMNFLVEESVCRDLETLVSSGKRSRVVNEALKKELELIRRKRAVERVLTAPPKGKKFSTQEILDSLVNERKGR